MKYLSGDWVKRIGWFKPSRVIVGSVIIAITTTWAAGEVLSKRALARDHKIAAQVTDKIKTVCVGRFLIDMPETSKVELVRPTINGFDIASFKETHAEFQARVATRESEIRATPDQLGGDTSLELAKEVKTNSGLVGKLFAHSRTVTEGTAANGLELERHRYEAVSLEAFVHGEGITIYLGSKGHDPARIGDLPALIAKLVANPDSRIPTESGFCIDHAYVRDPLGADQLEQITMFSELPSHPDVDFTLYLQAGLKPDEGILKRGAASEAERPLLDRMRITRLRAAPRKIGQFTGEELVRSILEFDGTRVYTFWWEVNGTEDDVLHPRVVFRMDMGKNTDGPVNPSLTQGAAMILWDRVASSIRLTPANARKERKSVHRKL